ncbi:hypothetical protein [uncultured Paraglaciecola sp.]|uniref:hypothetical protein n=1 Tax=uncultured Paraglaciecola sp. TaxID=1765024 RepID=UPI00262E5BAE|nr:hypothetical protein [uncultured Paraglaciecola sp.]
MQTIQNAALQRLMDAFEQKDEEAGLEAAVDIADHVLTSLERITTALEAIAEAQVKIANPYISLESNYADPTEEPKEATADRMEHGSSL